ncbi:MAG: type ISP restriction/modification enzyme [Phycisphaerae bacterium]
MNPLETYLRELRDIHSSGAAVPETSYYGPLERLLNETGKTLKPKVRCIINLANRGAGVPDGGLFTPDQIRKDDLNPMQGQLPSRGVIEVKSTSEDVAAIAAGEQVQRYCTRYGVVLVTNYRDFTLVARDPSGRPAALESYRLAASEDEFWSAAVHPRTLAEKHGERFTGYLLRALQHNAPLADPKDLAWFLASYARDALARVKGSNLPALAGLRAALEESLGMKFRGDRGEHFFESTLIQTLFYGVFSAWVLWAREHPPTDRTPFDWMHSASYLRVPVLRKLFHEAADPGQLDALNLSEVLNWATAALNRVDRASFFQSFQQHHAVQYFYEPFLEAYDPALRKQLGVWYTPPEIVQYMVKRVDRVLREELAVEDGLADERVYVLDPCCGTGAFLVAVLDRIAATMRDKGGDALVSHDLKTAVQQRVFGFEILPAPYVVSHLQLGLRLADLGVPLTGRQRVGVYLTNALTGWEPPKEPQNRLPFVEFQEEHDAADGVKQSAPILVILGNPPYNGFADVEVGEERDLSTAYRTTARAPKPQGQGLNDLYVRFFRMAERRIVDKTGKGIVCFISNYSWLDGLSHTGMRERYIEAFDHIWIDCLNGDKYKTGKLTPDGKPDPSVFSTEFNREGIQVGTAIALMVRKEMFSREPQASAGTITQGGPHSDGATISFRHLWGKQKRAELLASADNDGMTLYGTLSPPVELGYPFRPGMVVSAYVKWPRLPDLMPVSFPGIKTSRDDVVVDIDREKLVARMETYFDPNCSIDELRSICPSAATDAARFDAAATRQHLLRRGLLRENFFPYLYRPFDLRWLYWEPETKLLDEKRAEYVPNVRPGNVWLVAVQQNRKDFDPPIALGQAGSLHLIERGANLFPLTIYPSAKTSKLFGGETSGPKPNLSEHAAAYLRGLGFTDLNPAAECLFHHILAILHAPAYRTENAGALRQDWPRIPLPATREALESSAALGRRIAALLDVTQGVSGVTAGKIDPEIKAIGLITHVEGKQINDADDLAVTAGWGNPGRGGITMPAAGKAVRRDYQGDEIAAVRATAPHGEPAPSQAEAPRDGLAVRRCGPDMRRGPTHDEYASALGQTTYDVYLNDKVYWRNIPAAVWEYTLGGYQVIKKWLSYRERKILGRPLRADEARHVTEMARRIAAILLLHPALDGNYRRVSAGAFAWAPK